MPHFFAKNLNALDLKNRSGEYFDFVLEAINIRDKSTLILAQNKSDLSQKIILLKQQKNDKFLVKFNKHFKVQSREAIKNALKDYAKLTNADIIAHNLNANKCEAQSQYLLDSRGILAILGESAKFRDCMLEIGFGSGRHILNLARNHPNALIIGLEIYRPAILQVLRQIELLGLKNLYLASIDARVILEVLPRESLSAIFLHFPVPWEKNPQRRVFSEIFLKNAIAALKPHGGRFELITDSKEYFIFAKKLVRIYKHKITLNPQNAVVSKYEARWQRLKKDIYKLEIFPQKRVIFGLLALFNFYGLLPTYFFKKKVSKKDFGLGESNEILPTLNLQSYDNLGDSRELNEIFRRTLQNDKILDLRESKISLDCHEGYRNSRNDSMVDSHDSTFAKSNNGDDGVTYHNLASSKSRNGESFLLSHNFKNLTKNAKINAFAPQKIYKKEYFLQVKDIYESSDGFVIYIVFGAYYAPSSAYIIARKHSKYCEMLGDIIPTNANLSALNDFFGSYA